MSQNPIGLFDSGIGGTSIWKEVVKLLPNENTIYLADSKHAPYGEKTTEEIIELTGSSSKIIYNPLPVDDPRVRQPDITKAKNVLGWEPMVRRAEGLRKTMDYFKNKMG